MLSQVRNGPFFTAIENVEKAKKVGSHNYDSSYWNVESAEKVSPHCHGSSHWNVESTEKVRSYSHACVASSEGSSHSHARVASSKDLMNVLSNAHGVGIRYVV